MRERKVVKCVEQLLQMKWWNRLGVFSMKGGSDGNSWDHDKWGKLNKEWLLKPSYNIGTRRLYELLDGSFETNTWCVVRLCNLLLHECKKKFRCTQKVIKWIPGIKIHWELLKYLLIGKSLTTHHEGMCEPMENLWFHICPLLLLFLHSIAGNEIKGCKDSWSHAAKLMKGTFRYSVL